MMGGIGLGFACGKLSTCRLARPRNDPKHYN